MQLKTAREKMERRWRRRRGCLPNELEVAALPGGSPSLWLATELYQLVEGQHDLIRRTRLVGQNGDHAEALVRALEAALPHARTLQENSVLGSVGGQSTVVVLEACLAAAQDSRREIENTRRLTAKARRRRGNRAPDAGLVGMRALRRAGLTNSEIADVLTFCFDLAVDTGAVRKRLGRAGKAAG